MAINSVAPINAYQNASQAAQQNTNKTQQTTQTQTSTSNQSTTAGGDTVTISNAAKAAYQEAIETPEQNTQEARNGDRQAQQLLAREAAAEKLLTTL